MRVLAGARSLRGRDVASGSGSGAVRLRVLLAAMASCAVVGGCGTNRSGERAEAEGPVVRDLDIKGADAVAPRKIKKKIVTSETGWWWPLARKRRFDPIIWRSDLARIERLYESQGYFQGKVVSEQVRPVDDGKGVELEVTVEEGQPTKIGRLELKGLDVLGDGERARVLEDLPLSPGRVFREGDWAAGKEQLAERMRELGFADADVDAQALVDVERHEANLLIVVDPGIRYRFAGIEVRLPDGSSIAPVWVWEQARLAIPEGEFYSDAALAEAQRRVFAMGVFASARVTAGARDPASQRIGVVVEAREAPFRTLRAGAGIRVDQIRNEARLILEWSHRNFGGGMRRLTARAQAGWAFIPNTYAVVRDDVAAGARHGPIARTGLEFEQPRLFGMPSLRERSSIELEKTLEQSYDAIGGRLRNGISWQPHSSLTVTPTHNLQAYWLEGPPLASAISAPLALGCPLGGGSPGADNANSCFIWLSYLEQLAVWDRRDNILEPRNGFYASLSLQEGGGPLRGDFTYLRVEPDVRGYVSFGEDDELTFAGRVRFGELWPRAGQESAVVTRFFAGGGASMRGFNERRLSPLILAPAPVSAGSAPVFLTLPIGGNGMIDGSFEVRYQLTANLVVAAFVDFGQVTRSRLGPDDFGRMLWAVGGGIRYRTPVGPIRLDIGRRLQVGRLPPLLTMNPMTGTITEDDNYPVDDSCFGLGGSGVDTVVRDNLCVLHISIGEAF